MTNKGWDNLKDNGTRGTDINLEKAYSAQNAGGFNRDDIVSLPSVQPLEPHLDDFDK